MLITLKVKLTPKNKSIYFANFGKKMKQYIDLVKDILANGTQKGDRTGTGTISVFGRQLRFNLQAGFPLLTTKKVHLKSIIHELLWFLKGETNIAYLTEHKVRIWNEWADENGNLGPVYAHQWRNFGGQYDNIRQPKPSLPKPHLPTILGIATIGKVKVEDTPKLYQIWLNLLHKCYDKTHIDYPIYGKKGYHLCNDWLVFEHFLHDVQQWKSTTIVLENLSDYTLTTNRLPNNFCFGPKTCQWVLKTAVVNQKRKEGVDQIKQVIQQIKNTPNSRRMIVSAWNPVDLPFQGLPSCHTLFQFYVADGKLSCQLYQRSADTFLGVPFNIASYALLTMMIAQVCDLAAGDFVHTFGDTHLYNNHLAQAKLQINREPRPLPTMTINPAIKDIFDFTYKDFTLTNYNPHPRIKAKVSV